MSAQLLFLLSVILYLVGAAAALVARTEKTARIAAGLAALLAAITGLTSALAVLLTGVGFTYQTAGFFPLARFALRCDMLSAFMVGAISLLSAATSLYSLSYLQPYENRGVRVLGFFTNLFLASMLLVVIADSAFYFLIFWELMTLCSYFLVIVEQEKEGIKAGYIYFLMAHAGTLLIMLSFFLFFFYTGSFDFASFRSAALPPFAQGLAFVLAFFGFGVKAGIVPLHMWLPLAHPAAPSHISALMSGIMIKIAIYGIIRIGIDFLAASEWWWGVLILVFGAVTALIGVLYALAERDLKRLLAYSSVENVGIILMGVGVAMVGMPAHQPVIATLGLLAALYHLINHAAFKGLLFLGAGSVVYRLHTKDMEKMGGLAKAMPWTALAFLVGALAVSAVPPLNGFVSEWFTYQSLFTASNLNLAAVRTLAPLVMVVLALTGVLAAMCFVKAYGLTFAGISKSDLAGRAIEVPRAMVAAMGLLAVCAILLGVAAPVVAPYIENVASQLVKGPSLPVASGATVFPANATQASLSMPLVAVLLLALAALPLLIVAVFGGWRAGRRTDETPWACGYGYSTRMAISANSFGQPLRVFLRPLYAARTLFNAPASAVSGYLGRAVTSAFRAESLWENYVTQPITAGAQNLGRQIQVLQMGDIRVYCLYIVVTLALLLIAAVR